MPDSGAPFGEILGLFIGKTAAPWPGKPPTAIGKTAVNGSLRVTELGFEGDQQADLSVHGGPDQAVHHYASEHMLYWTTELSDQGAGFAPGCFGENVSTTGLDEYNLCIGDVLSMGTAKVQITQGRQPCWKLNDHMGRPEMASRFQITGKTGWYYRVLEAGVVAAGDFMHVVERPSPEWSVAKVTKARFDPRLEPSMAKEVSEIVHLSKTWRGYFRDKCHLPDFQK